MNREDIAISFDNISKKYVIKHQLNAGYSSLRDRFTDGVRSLSQLLFARRKELSTLDEDFFALKDISFEVKRGDRVGIIGRNGAGKSTLLKILSRITEPTTGQIIFSGRVASLLEVGTGFHPELTGRENIYLNGAILGMTKKEIQRKFDEIVDFAEIEKFLDTPVKRYSSGMYVRLAFSVAAHLESEILIVDEVLAVGDLEFQRKCLGKMQSITMKQDRTILFVSHNINALEKLCTHCVYLKQGRLEAYDKTAKVLSHYISDFTLKARANRWISILQAQRTGSNQSYFSRIKYSGSDPKTNYEPIADGRFSCIMEVFSDCYLSVNSMAVIIYDKSGFKLANMDTLSIRHVIQLEPGYNQVEFRVNALHLKPGTYILGLWMARDIGFGLEPEIIDFCENCLEFDVTPSDQRQVLVEDDGVVTSDFHVVQHKTVPYPGKD